MQDTSPTWSTTRRSISCTFGAWWKEAKPEADIKGTSVASCRVVSVPLAACQLPNWVQRHFPQHALVYSSYFFSVLFCFALFFNCLFGHFLATVWPWQRTWAPYIESQRHRTGNQIAPHSGLCEVLCRAVRGSQPKRGIIIIIKTIICCSVPYLTDTINGRQQQLPLFRVTFRLLLARSINTHS